MMKFVKNLIDRFLEVITVTLFFIMVGVTIWQIIARYILNDPSGMTEEFISYSLIWLSLLSAAYVVGKKSHIAITLLSGNLTQSKKLILDIIIQSSFLGFGAIIMVYGGIRAASLSINQISPSLSISMGLVYLSLPVAGLLMIFYSIYNVIELVNERNTTSEI